jgi:DNA-binding NarL/FixJ family response regulator
MCVVCVVCVGGGVGGVGIWVMRENGFGWVKGAGPEQASRQPARANGTGNSTPQHRAAREAIPPLQVPTFDFPAIARRLKLSPQQTQIAQHFLRDETIDVIAKLLGCEVSSVKTQIARMYRKHNIHSRAAMCSLVYETAIRMMGEEG